MSDLRGRVRYPLIRFDKADVFLLLKTYGLR